MHRGLVDAQRLVGGEVGAGGGVGGGDAVVAVGDAVDDEAAGGISDGGVGAADVDAGAGHGSAVEGDESADAAGAGDGPPAADAHGGHAGFAVDQRFGEAPEAAAVGAVPQQQVVGADGGAGAGHSPGVVAPGAAGGVAVGEGVAHLIGVAAWRAEHGRSVRNLAPDRVVQPRAGILPLHLGVVVKARRGSRRSPRPRPPRRPAPGRRWSGRHAVLRGARPAAAP